MATIVLAAWFLAGRAAASDEGPGGARPCWRSSSRGCSAGYRVLLELDDPGRRPRLHGPGVLRPDGRPLRLHRARLVDRPSPPTRPGSPAAARGGDAGPGLRPDRGRGWLRHFGRPAALVVHAVARRGRLGPRGGPRLRVERNKADGPLRSCPSARAMALAGDAPDGPRGSAPGGCSGRSTAIARPVTHPAGPDPDRAPGSTGALLLASSVVLTLRAFRHLARPLPIAGSPSPSTDRSGGRRMKTAAIAGPSIWPSPTGRVLADAGGRLAAVSSP